MAGPIDSYSLPPAVRRIATSFRIFGWVSFWVQIVLAVVASLVLLFASLNENADNPATGFGLFFATCGLVTLYLGVFWAFRYTRLAKRLKGSGSGPRPKPKDAMQALRLGLIINLVGMLLTLMGAEAIVGALLAKSLAQPQGVGLFNSRNITQFIQSLDIFLVQANTHTLVAHFVGIVASLFLVQSVNRQ
ncbi:MAG: DUF3611 family protein [Cyanothece sp. SIO1E1]|nr:DUF3611 family protein [Cyanothece sp. SIO1E1]